MKCLQCGECCRWPGYVHLSEADIERLAGHLRIAERVFIDRYSRLSGHRASLSLTEKEDGSCIFLEGTSCAVYTARPEQCRDFGVHWFLSGCRGLWEIDCENAQMQDPR